MRRALVCLVAAALLLPACTGEDDSKSPRSDSSEAAVVRATAKPKVEVPKGTPPTELVTEDLKVGTGERVLPGHVVSVHYVGVEYDTGEEFDTSWDGGNPFQFTLGGGDVIPGWDKGVLGMRVGGQRKLVIPPDLAYGTAPGHPLAGKTLVFVVDVMSTGGAPAGAGEDPLSS